MIHQCFKCGAQASVLVCYPTRMCEVMNTASAEGTWCAVICYANQRALYNGEAGMWRGMRYVEDNYVDEDSLTAFCTDHVPARYTDVERYRLENADKCRHCGGPRLSQANACSYCGAMFRGAA